MLKIYEKKNLGCFDFLMKYRDNKDEAAIGKKKKK